VGAALSLAKPMDKDTTELYANATARWSEVFASVRSAAQTSKPVTFGVK
jgi:hypothetical protein